ncbi:MAG: penicillin-binding protein 2 [Solirubrobacterales bacterium]|nr:penicillin-binding protein 2 [Solirubrobacterales bacterium]
MNAPISRLFAITLLLFAVLVFFTSKWTVFEAEDLRANRLNARPLLEQTFIERGRIRSADREVVARSVRHRDDTFSRVYPQQGLFAHAVGFSFVDRGQDGIERYYNDELTGKDDPLGNVIDQLSGNQKQGDDLDTHLDAKAQRVALEGLAGRKGAVVALDPQTGAVQVMASVPGYDPNDVDRPKVLSQLNRDDANAPLVNRATQAGYPPGSTMKVVTAIAAIDSGKFQPGSQVSGENGKKISGVPLNNFGGEDFGQIDLTFALTKSVNTAWAAVGESLGKATMQKYMKRLGFGSDPPMDYPDEQMRPSGEYVKGRVVPATHPAVDVGRMAIGQDKLNVTPLQMAMVAAAVANDGKLMAPRIGDRFIDPDGRTNDVETDEMSEVMSVDSARKVNQMMQNVVREGSGTAAALQGIDVAGKTGTAEVDRPCGPNQVWFIGFAPARDPKVAVAVTLECSDATGGTVAAPIAKRVMESLLR